MNDFPFHLSHFFSSFLREQKGVSSNTIQSYADAFLLLFQYYSSLGIPEKEISFSVLTKQKIEGFLSCKSHIDRKSGLQPAFDCG